MIQTQLQHLLVLHKEEISIIRIEEATTKRSISHGELLQSTDTPDLSAWQ